MPNVVPALVLPTHVTLGSDVTNATTSLADCTGLSFVVAANTTYRVRFVMQFQNTSTSRGVSVSLNGPSSPTSVYFNVHLANYYPAFALSMTRSGSGAAYDAAISVSAVAAANTSYPAVIEGALVNGENAGTMIVRFSTTSTSSTATIKAGSYGMLWEV